METEGITLNSDSLIDSANQGADTQGADTQGADTQGADTLITSLPSDHPARKPTNYKEWLEHDLKRKRVDTSAAMRQRVQLEIDRLKQQRESNLVIIENRDYDCPNADLYLKLREAFPGRETKEDLLKIPQVIDRYLNPEV